MGEQAPLEVLQFRAGVYAQVIGQQCAHLPQRRESFRLAGTAIQPQDEQLPATFAVGLVAYGRTELGYRGGSIAHSEQCRCLVFQCGGVLFDQLMTFLVAERLQVGIRTSPPEFQSTTEVAQCISWPLGCASLGDKGFEIEDVRLGDERVTAGSAGEGLGAQQLAQRDT